MSDKKIYMIRRVTDGLFSSGTSYPYFSKRGKMWTTVGSLKSHMLMVMERCDVINYLDKTYHPDKFYEAKNPYKDCEIVESEISYKPVQNAFQFFADYQMKKAEKKK